MSQRTVYTWVVPYKGKDGQEHWSDGGPYLNKRNAEVRGLMVHAQLVVEKGSVNVKDSYVREHLAPVEQKCIEEIFPDMITRMREKHAHLFANEHSQQSIPDSTGN